MSAFDVAAGERVLFVFTHPDDELGLTAFIGRLLSRGVAVRVCWTHSTPVREAESRAAMGALGLAQGSLTFLGGKDGAVVDSLPELRPAMRSLIAEHAPTRAVTLAFEQGHIDHDATNLLVNLCFDGPVYETPLYHTYLTKTPKLHCFSSHEGEETILITPEERAVKKRLVRMYPSQTLRRNLMMYEMMHALTMRRPRLFLYERMRLQRHKDFLRPSHPAALARRVEACRTWKRWVAAVRPLL